MSDISPATSNTANGPQPSLIAILLVTRTRAGPRLLLHYPPSCSGPTPFEAVTLQSKPKVKELDEKRSQKAGESARRIPGKGARKAHWGGRAGSHADGKHSSRGLRDQERKDVEHQTNGNGNEYESQDDDARYESSPNENEATIPMVSPSSPTQPQHTYPIAPSSNTPFNPPPPQSSIPANNETWTHILSFPADGLAKLLAPTGRKSWHKRKLQVCLGGMWFIGCPVHEKEEGGWVGEKAKRGRSGDHVGNGMTNGMPRTKDKDGSSEDEGTRKSPHTSPADATTTVTTSSAANVAATPIPTYSDPVPSISPDAPADPSTSFTTTTTTTSSTLSSNAPTKTTATTPDTLTMFNIVFVLAPPTTSSTGPSETEKAQGVGVEEVYTHCAKKLAKVLQYRQKRSGYVWEDVRRIMAGRIAAREGGVSYTHAWPHLSMTSSLARALASVYNGLTTSRVAHLTLGTNMTLSLQLPQQASTSHIPTPTSPTPATSGLWLTTFSPYPLDGDSPHVDGTGAISPHSSLLLLVPAETLLKEIAASPPSQDSARLAFYIRRHLLPTKTLQQMSRKSQISLQDLQRFSLHLIHWRRARAISPLHHTNTYIVSPLAEWEGLEAAAVAFRARFAALPSLPSVLARLSAAAQGKGMQAWGRLMPTSDHKEAYMEMLEWLVKGGWVTQLRTFAWVEVSKNVKVEVARKLKAEERNAANPVEESEEGDMDEGASGSGSGAKRRKSSQGSASLLSPRLKPHLFQSPRRLSDTGSFASVSTALRIPLRSNLRLDPSSATHTKHGRPHRLSDVSMASKVLLDEKTPPESVDVDSDGVEFDPSIVISPHKANRLESKWLEHIGNCLPDADVRELWPRLLKYFDGKHAVEEIAMQEGLKRKAVTPVLAKLMGEDGVLKVVRHW